jgi:hypothetical protein
MTVPTTSATTTQVAVASVCYIPYDTEKKLKEAWNEYYSLVQTNGTIDMEKMKIVKETISTTEQEINKIKQNCQPTSTSGASGSSGGAGQPTSTTKVCPVVIAPDFEKKCTMSNGTITKNFDDKGCLSSYDCVTSTGIISPTSTTTPQPTEPSTAPGQAVSSGENCTVPVELTQEFEGLWKNYKEAIANNDTQKAEAFKSKISEIEKKLSETKGQCVKTIVTEKTGAKDVVSYYKNKVTEVLTQEGDTDSQIIQLKDLRNEIDKLIVDLINKNNKMNASEVSGVVDEIKMRRNAIQAGNSTISTTTATISTQINKQNIDVKPSETGVTITDGAVSVDVPELSIKENKINMADKVVQVAPSEVMAKAKMQKTKQLNMSVENGTPVYDIKGDENRKLLWVIPVTMEKQVKVDATNGNVIKEEKPWWSGLTSESTETTAPK